MVTEALAASKKSSEDTEDTFITAMRTAMHEEGIKDRTLFLDGQVTHARANVICYYIEKFNAEDDELSDSKTYDRMSNPIKLIIDSPGGYCTAGLAIISAIEQSETPVVTVAAGNAASMAFHILAAGHVRFSYRHSELMHHQHSGAIIGTFTDSVETIERRKELQDRLDNLLIQRTHITRAKIDEVNMRKLDWAMWPEEALELGAIDKIIPRGMTIKKEAKSFFTEARKEHDSKEAQILKESEPDPVAIPVSEEKKPKISRKKASAPVEATE